MNLETWLALFAAVFIIADWLLVSVTKIAVRAKLHRISFIMPLLASPILSSLLLAYNPISASAKASIGATGQCIPTDILYRFTHVKSDFDSGHHWMFFGTIGCGLISLVLLTLYLWTDRSFVYALDRHLFSIPVFRPIFSSTSLLLHRKREDDPDRKIRTKSMEGRKTSSSYYDESSQTIPMLFICTTLWHEEENEMEQLLNSLVRLCCQNKESKEAAKEAAKVGPTKFQKFYNLEIHIFFDNVFEKVSDKKQLNKWVSQFCNILKSLIIFYEVDLDDFNFEVIPAPYGGRFEMRIAGVPFFVHLKDVEFTQNGKRWSQVMYMYYLIGYRMKNCQQNVPGEFFVNKTTQNIEQASVPITEENTYIMALDGDVDFYPKSVESVLDRLTRNKSVAAACNEIKPVGSGWLVWFQRFEYAVGHWLQKTTEHVLGCVLCSPGCFSIIRVKYLTLDNVMALYKSIAETPMQKLMYDQGEDRWLCTRILLAGGRIEFEAGSECDTFAPEDLATFYKQRRRWGPSTTANIWELIRNRSLATKNRSISSFYVVYHAVCMFMSMIGLSTTCLMIAQALEFAATGGNVFAEDSSAWDEIWPKLVVFVPVIAYIILCAIESLKDYQIKVASALSSVFSLLMLYVFVAVIVQGVACPFNPTFLFFTFMAAIMVIAAICHGEIVTLMCGIVYWLCIPSCFIFLQIYSLANMNDVSWGTRQEKKAGEPEPPSFMDRLCCKTPTTPTPQADSTDKEAEKAKKDLKRMQTVRKTKSGHKRWTQRNKGGITAMVHRARLSLGKTSNAGEQNSIQNLKSHGSSSSKRLPPSTNFQQYSYEPTDKDSFLTTVPSRAIYDRKIAVDERIMEDSRSGNLEWALVEQRPILITNTTKCAAMSTYEYKFWLDMIDPKTGYIRKQGKDPSEQEEMKKKSEKMTSEMKTFKNRMYNTFIYINVFWIVVCSLVQIFGHKLKIMVFTEAFVNNTYPADPVECSNADIPSGTKCHTHTHQMCRESMLAGFPPFEFFFLFFYVALILIQFSCMIRHRVSTFTHWLSQINMKRSYKNMKKSKTESN